MDMSAILRALFDDKPFFGGATRGIQTGVKSQLVLTALVSVAVKSGRPIRVLEVGSWLGASALTWAYAIERFAGKGEVLCIDTWAPYLSPDDIASENEVYAEMDGLVRSGLAYELFRHNVATGPRRVSVGHRRGSSRDILPTLDEASFDIVYIDGSHYYEAARADILAAQTLVAEGGILAGDDLELQLGAEIDEATVRANLARDYVSDAAIGSYHPGVTLAVAETLGRVSSVARQWFMRRTGAVFSPFSLDGARMIIAPHWTPEMQAKARALLGPGAATRRHG